MADRSWLAGRYGTLVLVAATWFAASLTTRLLLLAYEGDATLLVASTIARIAVVGLLYDAAALSWLILPFAALAQVWPAGERGNRGHRRTAGLTFCALVGALSFQMLAELLFWNEFSSRFNFIAVDYLVYTREVVGNIWQSYPIGWLLVAVAAATVVAIAALGPICFRMAGGPAPGLRVRAAVSVVLASLPALFYLGLGEGPHRLLATPVERELAGNGLYALFQAYRNNDLDYGTFYATLPSPRVAETLAAELLEARAGGATIVPGESFEREVRPDRPAIRKNVVLISIESLGADYVEAFGGRPGLTPNLSRLADESLTFHRLYATGLRTVRGLEALTLSLPPTPGQAVPIRKRNRGLMSLGSVLKERGYDTLYLYGGYSFFDNMKDFFGGAGYEVKDRTNIAGSRIHHETIWGVADEDLFDMALEELDRRAADGHSFFAHIMTTSNHRPYTYPEGRVDIPSHSGRDGAVKYTDWAIGRFLRQAATKPWFGDTVFVLVADHTSEGRGRIDLPPENYRIPLWIHAPGFVAPGRIDWIASQIDIAPTVLGLLNIPYRSRFFGQDILREGQFHQRAFMANYLTVGYMEAGLVVELAPQHRVRVVRAVDGMPVRSDDPVARHYIEEAVSHYQMAARYIELNARAE